MFWHSLTMVLSGDNYQLYHTGRAMFGTHFFEPKMNFRVPCLLKLQVDVNLATVTLGTPLCSTFILLVKILDLVKFLLWILSIACKSWGAVFAKIYNFRMWFQRPKWRTPVTCLFKLSPPPRAMLKKIWRLFMLLDRLPEFLYHE